MKAYLYSNKGIFKLGPKVTTIGLNGCDLILKNSTIEEQHAIIEFTNEGVSEGYFTILDFGSHHGTYLNSLCINPNMAVLLENHSSLQFGKDSTVFEFVVEHGYDNIKRAWNQNDNNYLIEEVGMHLPQLNTSIHTTLKSYSNGYKPPASRAMLPPANRSRPVSAEMLYRQASPLRAKTKNHGAGWINGPSLMRSSSSSDLHYLEEKETKLDHLEDELRRLNQIEIASQKKDFVIGQLGQEIKQLKQQMIGAHDNTIQDKLYYLEKEVQSKKEEINILKNKINRPNMIDHEDNSSFKTTDIKENIQLKNNLAKLEFEKQDLSLQINILRTTLITKDQEVDTLKNKICDLNLINEGNENAKHTLNNELEELRSANEKYENKIKDLHHDKEIFVSDIYMLKNENTNFSNELSNTQRENEQLKLNISNLTMKNDEIIDKISRLENELSNFNDKEDSLKIQLNNTLNKNISNILDIPDIINHLYNEKEQLLNELRNKDEMLIFDQSEMKHINKYIEQIINVLKSNSSNGNVISIMRQLNEDKQNNFSLIPQFQHFIASIVSCLNEDEKRIVNIVNKYNRQPIHNNEDIWKLLETKFDELEESKFETNSLRNELKMAEERIFVETNSIREELNVKHAEEIHKIKNDDYLITKNLKLENDLHDLQNEFEQTSIKARNDGNNLKNENAKLLIQLNELNQLLSEKEFLLEKLSNENIDFSKTLDHLKSREADLVDRLRGLDDIDTVKMRVELLERELGERCEQIRQHALTICAMDEQINNAAIRTNEYKEEISRLRTKISELQNNGNQLQPMPPSKPRPIVHIATPLIRETNTHIQRENNDLLNKISEQQDIIQSLSKDLAAAEAQLSDVHGEMSEGQKRCIEETDREIRRRDIELIELQQQMLQLTQLIDQLKAKLVDAQHTEERLEGEVATKSELVKRHEQANGELRSQLNKSQAENNVKIAALEEQQKVSAELALQGASCRGDRHDVILARQREALTEMRAKIRALESGDIPLLSQNEAIQQLAYMKQELDELRSMQASRNKIDDNIRPEYNQSIKQLAETLQLSENNYISLLRGVSSCLNIGEIEGMHPLLGLNLEEQRRLANQRHRSLSQIVDVITNLKQRIHRKEELLHGYEKDLKHIRRRSSSNGNIISINDMDKKKNQEIKMNTPSIMGSKMKSKESNKANLFKHQKITNGNIHNENDSNRNMSNHKRNSSRDSRPKEKKISFKHKEMDVV